MKKIIFATIDDLALNFVAYDRKEDDELPRGAIEDAVETGVVTVGEMVERFAVALHDQLQVPLATSQVRITSDHNAIDIVDAINKALATRGLALVDDGLPHDGYIVLTLRVKP